MPRIPLKAQLQAVLAAVWYCAVIYSRCPMPLGTLLSGSVPAANEQFVRSQGATFGNSAFKKHLLISRVLYVYVISFKPGEIAPIQVF